MMSPLFDNLTDLYNYEYSSGCLMRIFASCVLALGVNISNYLVLGKTSPLTYQVLGHMKTILILVLGFLFFNVSSFFFSSTLKFVYCNICYTNRNKLMVVISQVLLLLWLGKSFSIVLYHIIYVFCFIRVIAYTEIKRRQSTPSKPVLPSSRYEEDNDPLIRK